MRLLSRHIALQACRPEAFEALDTFHALYFALADQGEHCLCHQCVEFFGEMGGRTASPPVQLAFPEKSYTLL
jgi:hypothetical protein